jgi:tetratricopeptide (TPR) repeat protein
MSYINDALEKAQKSKDSLYRHYERVISASTNQQTNVKTKWMIRSGVIVVILLVLLVFSLLSYHIFLGTAGNEAIVHKSVKDKNGQTLTREGAGVSEPRVIKDAPAKSQDMKDMYKEALNHQRNNNLIEAEELYGKILKSDPDFVLVLNNLGVIYMSQKRNEEAKNIFSKAIDLKADYVDPYYNLACLYSQSGNIPESLEYLKRAISINIDVKNWAKNDKDLKNVRISAAYKEIMEQ